MSQLASSQDEMQNHFNAGIVDGFTKELDSQFVSSRLFAFY